jgi:serine/threonine-protein phosphatase 2A regulatory subunit B
MVSSYSNAKFIKNGKYIIARDFLTVKLWDIANTSKPLSTITLQ